jgi:hypothetical protein
MKQKYLISKNEEKQALVIQEFAEIDKDILSITCEEEYDDAAIESAIEKGKGKLSGLLRTQNLFPPGFYMDKIAESVMSIYGSQIHQPIELFFDETDYLQKDRETLFTLEDEAESSEMEDLLDDNFDEDYEEKTEIKNINAPLKLAEDETLDTEED